MSDLTWVSGCGPVPCEVMMIGEAPALEEVRTGVPFTGKTGRELDQLLRTVCKVKRKDIRITNAFKYMVPDAKKVTADEWEMMRDLLMEEVEECDPSLIVTLGGMSTRMVLGDRVSVEAANGVPHAYGERTVIPCIHPAASFHDPDKSVWVREALEIVGETVRNGWTDAIIPAPPRFARCPLNLTLAAPSLMIGRKRCIAIDTETYDDGSLYMITVATGGDMMGYEAAIVDLEKGGSDEQIEEIAMWLRQEDTLTVIHNAMFDLPLLADVGIVPSQFIDTMQMAFLLQTVPIGLKSLTYRLCGWTMRDYEDVVGDAPELACVPDYEAVVQYALTDPVATLGVLEQMGSMVYEGMDGVLARDQGVMPMVMAMEARGMLVDQDFLAEFGRELMARSFGVLEEIREAVGDPTYNPNSAKQSNAVLYKKLGLGKGKRIKETVWGRSTGSAAMKQVKDEHPVVRKITDWKETMTLISRYVDGLPKHIADDGRIHTSLSLTRIKHSGRLASSKPNMMAQPSRSEDGRKIKEAFVAAPGFVIVSIDYSQIEMRLLAHLSQDKVMLDKFRRNADIHAETAAHMFGIPLEEVDENEHRRPAKTTGFGLVYGISAMGLARDMADIDGGKWTEAACQDMIDAWFELYEGAHKYIRKVEKEAMRDGKGADMWGRMKYENSVWSVFEHLQEEALRKSVNMRIQGGAQGIIKEAMVQLWPWMELAIANGVCYPLIQIHDDITVECLETSKEYVVAKMVEVMENAVPLSIPTPVDVKWGESWGRQVKMKL